MKQDAPPSARTPARPRLAARLLRYTCPVVVFAYLVWQAVASANWKLALCLVALVGTLGGGLAAARHLTHLCERAPTLAARQARLAAAMGLTRQLGGVFCGMALGIGLCYSFETRRFLGVALPLLLSGWGAMGWLLWRFSAKQGA